MSSGSVPQERRHSLIIGTKIPPVPCKGLKTAAHQNQLFWLEITVAAAAASFPVLPSQRRGLCHAPAPAFQIRGVLLPWVFAEIAITISLRNGAAKKAVCVPASLVNCSQLAQPVCSFLPRFPASSQLPPLLPAAAATASAFVENSVPHCFCNSLRGANFFHICWLSEIWFLCSHVKIYRLKFSYSLSGTALPHTMLCSTITQAPTNSPRTRSRGLPKHPIWHDQYCIRSDVTFVLRN